MAWMRVFCIRYCDISCRLVKLHRVIPDSCLKGPSTWSHQASLLRKSWRPSLLPFLSWMLYFPQYRGYRRMFPPGHAGALPDKNSHKLHSSSSVASAPFQLRCHWKNLDNLRLNPPPFPPILASIDAMLLSSTLRKSRSLKYSSSNEAMGRSWCLSRRDSSFPLQKAELYIIPITAHG